MSLGEQEPDRHVATSEFMKGSLEPLPPSPLDEADDHEYAIGGRHLAFELEAETWFV